MKYSENFVLKPRPYSASFPLSFFFIVFHLLDHKVPLKTLQKAEERLNRLKEWKRQKEQRLKQEAANKKPDFVPAGVKSTCGSALTRYPPSKAFTIGDGSVASKRPPQASQRKTTVINEGNKPPQKLAMKAAPSQRVAGSKPTSNMIEDKQTTPAGTKLSTLARKTATRPASASKRISKKPTPTPKVNSSQPVTVSCKPRLCPPAQVKGSSEKMSTRFTKGSQKQQSSVSTRLSARIAARQCGKPSITSRFTGRSSAKGNQTTKVRVVQKTPQCAPGGKRLIPKTSPENMPLSSHPKPSSDCEDTNEVADDSTPREEEAMDISVTQKEIHPDPVISTSNHQDMSHPVNDAAWVPGARPKTPKDHNEVCFKEVFGTSPFHTFSPFQFNKGDGATPFKFTFRKSFTATPSSLCCGQTKTSEGGTTTTPTQVVKEPQGKVVGGLQVNSEMMDPKYLVPDPILPSSENAAQSLMEGEHQCVCVCVCGCMCGVYVSVRARVCVCTMSVLV